MGSLLDSDIRISANRSSTDTFGTPPLEVVVTHLPTLTTVRCSTERSYHANLTKAMGELRALLDSLKDDPNYALVVALRFYERQAEKLHELFMETDSAINAIKCEIRAGLNK